MDWKKTWKKIWHFLWHEDSILSWITSIVIAFILIKFIVYPGLGVVLGTNLPVVAVISESMDHSMTLRCTNINSITKECIKYNYEICGNNFDKKSSINFDRYWELCGEWYDNRSITKEEFQTYAFKNGFKKGDIIILKGVDYDKLEIGKVIVFNAKYNYPVIHRVIDVNDFVQTKGDHNPRQIEDSKLNERYITKDQLLGQAWFKIPYLGYVKIFAVDLLTCVTGGGCFNK
jgi:signal peptidase I